MQTITQTDPLMSELPEVSFSQEEMFGKAQQLWDEMVVSLNASDHFACFRQSAVALRPPPSLMLPPALWF